MAIELFDNAPSQGVLVTLVAPLGATDTTMTVDQPASAFLQQAGGQFRVVITNPINFQQEIACVTSGQWSSRWTIRRGDESTPQAFPAGSPVRHVLTRNGLIKLILDVVSGAIAPTESSGSTTSGMTQGDVLAYVMNLLPISEERDPAILGIFGAWAKDPNGAPSDAQVFFPDGGYGHFKGLTFAPPSIAGVYPSAADEYTVAYRPYIDTSATDRQNYVPFDSERYLDGAPMSDVAAAALVTRTPEVRHENADPGSLSGTGIAPNFYIPSDAELAAMVNSSITEFYGAASVASATNNPYIPLVTGAAGKYIPQPTTDELIQWVSHKWGFPTNRIRAQMALESKWHMFWVSDLHDFSSEPTWPALYPAYMRLPGGVSVYATTSLAQCHWIPDGSSAPGSNPLRLVSAAFALDYYCSWIRFYLDDANGNRTRWGDTSYVAGDYAAHQGGWLHPYPWRNAGAVGVGDSTNGITITVMGPYSPNYAITIQANVSNPSNKDILIYRDGTLVTSVTNIVGGTFANARAALDPRTDTLVGTSYWGDQSQVMPNMTLQSISPYGSQMNYVNDVNIRVANPPWLAADWADTAAVQLWHQPLITRDVGGKVSNRPLPFLDTYVPPTAPPTASPNLVLFAGDGEVTLWWQAVPDDGGDPISSWLIVEYDQGWYTGQPFPGPFFVFAGLPNDGSSLRFAVQPQNGWGDNGPWSAPSNSATPTAGLPNAPTTVLVSADLTDGSISFSWTPPSPLPADSITSWNIYPIDETGALGSPISTGSSSNTYVLTSGLTLGDPYTFMVTGVNSVGEGMPSIPSAEVTPLHLIPPSRPRTAPTNLQLFAGDGDVVIFWEPPTDDGGEAIQGFTFAEPDEGWSQTRPMAPTIVGAPFAQLSNPHTVRFTIAAYNSLGTGPASLPSNSVTTTLGLPDQPTITGANTAGTGAVALTWNPPSPAPSATITDYIVIPVINNVPQTPIDTGSSSPGYTVTGLTSGTAYTFRIRAVNSVGSGLPSFDSGSVTVA